MIYVLVFLVLVFLLFYRLYQVVLQFQPLLSDEHLLEICKQLPLLKKAALLQIEASPPLSKTITFDDSRTFLSSANLAILYSISQTPDHQTLHYLFITANGKKLPLSIGSFFCIFVSKHLGLLPAKLLYQRDGSGGYFAMGTLSEEEMETFLLQKETILFLEEETIQTVQEELTEMREEIETLKKVITFYEMKDSSE